MTSEPLNDDGFIALALAAARRAAEAGEGPEGAVPVEDGRVVAGMCFD
mgnify:CR=1 FL=1